MWRLAKRSANSARRAWRPRLRTLMTVMLLVTRTPLTDNEVIAGATLDDSPSTLRTTIICAGAQEAYRYRWMVAALQEDRLHRGEPQKGANPAHLCSDLSGKKGERWQWKEPLCERHRAWVSGEESGLSRDCRVERSVSAKNGQ
jgi:hypothetical protein